MKSLVSKRLYALGAALGMAAALLPHSANATTQTGSFNVTSSVAKNCSVSATTLAYGAYDPVVANLASVLNGSNTMSVKCTKGTGSAVYVQANTGSNGAHASGSCAVATCTRAMTDGTDYLSYDLYTDSGYTHVWSPSATSGNTVFSFDFSTSGATQTATVYGQVPAAQNVEIGSYTDSITMTVNF